MDYQVEFQSSALKDLDDLPSRASRNILRKIEDLSATSFKIPQTSQLKGYDDLFRLRVGDYRIVYRLKGNQVTILLVAHRKDVYRRLSRLPEY